MTVVVVLLVTLLGLALRVLHLTSGTLWLDEGYLVIQSNTPFFELLRNAAQDGNTFFSIWVFKFWSFIFGKSEVSYESFACFFGVLAIPMMYVLMRNLFDRRAGLIGAFLLSISLFHILYSQEMRIYAFAIFVSLVAAAALAKYTVKRKRSFLFVFSGASVLLLHSHAYAIFIVSSFFLYLFFLVPGDSAHLRRTFKSAILVAVLFSPALYCELYQYFVLYRFDWIPKPDAEAVLLAFVRMSANSGWLLYAFPIVIFFGILTAVREKLAKQSLMLIMWFLLPLMATTLLSTLGRSFFQYTYMILILPPYLGLLSYGLSRIPTHAFKAIAMIGIVVLSVNPLKEYYAGRVASGSDKELYLYVQDHYKEGDVILHNSRHSFVPSLFYHDYALEEYFPDSVRSWHGFEYYGYRKKTQISVQDLQNYKRVWIVTHRSEFNDNLKSLLNDPAFLGLNPKILYASDRNRLLLFQLG